MRDAHLSDDGAVAKMGHPGRNVAITNSIRGSKPVHRDLRVGRRRCLGFLAAVFFEILFDFEGGHAA